MMDFCKKNVENSSLVFGLLQKMWPTKVHESYTVCSSRKVFTDEYNLCEIWIL